MWAPRSRRSWNLGCCYQQVCGEGLFDGFFPLHRLWVNPRPGKGAATALQQMRHKAAVLQSETLLIFPGRILSWDMP